MPNRALAEELQRRETATPRPRISADLGIWACMWYVPATPDRTTAMPATAPRPRSPAQIEAARRNGARSRGPVTAEGKARSLPQRAEARPRRPASTSSSRTRPPPSWRSSTARLIAEVEPESEIEARLVKRMAIAFWKSERAERIEVALFDAAPKLRPPQAGFQWEEADPLTTFDLKRFNAVRGYQAQQGRELSRCLKELRQLRRDALAECTDEPESTLQNEPEQPARPANDDASMRRHRRRETRCRSRGCSRAAEGAQAVRIWAEARLRRLRLEQAEAGSAALLPAPAPAPPRPA